MDGRVTAPGRADRWLAAGVVVAEIAHAAVLDAQGAGSLSTVGTVLLLAQTVPVAWRRRWPLAIAILCGIAAVLYGITASPDPLPLGPMLAFATLVASLELRPAVLVGLAVLAASVPSTVLPGDADAGKFYAAGLYIAVAWAAGVYLRLRDLQAASLVERVERVAAERDERTRRALAEERARIARELHDVVAHHVGMIVVQAEAGLASQDASAARLRLVADAGREALTDLRRLLGVLRDGGDDPGTAPQPGVEDLGALCGHVVDTGVTVDLAISPQAASLSRAMQLTVYRVVQEALTNVVKHSGAARARVRVDVDGLVVVAVDDDGHGRAMGLSGGHGLAGMAERVGLFGGTLTTGESELGGFAVRAEMPRGLA